MPSMAAQAALIKKVYESNNLEYGKTQYVEAHGTGTKAGDPVETGAIHRTIGQATTASRKKLHIGSVKPNIGHLEAAAGAASIIKGVLALENGLIPPSIRFSKPNPAIPLDEWNMVVPTKLTPWPAAQTKRMSVSGFGMGGTNAHVVLEASQSPNSYNTGVVTSPADQKRLFVFSSHDKAGFARIGKSLVAHVNTLQSAASNPAYLADFAHTLAVARSGLPWKAACLAEDTAELREHLLTVVGEDAARVPPSPPRVGFVFTGQGAQWAGMGMELLARRHFADSVAKSATVLKELGATWDPVTELCRGPKESRLGLPEISQPICTILQLALVDEIRSWGIVPSKVVGHSSGEIAAAYTMGALSHGDAIMAAYFRGVASAGVSADKDSGGMMAVGCSRDEAQKLMNETKLQVTIACINAPSSVTLSGPVATLETLRGVLGERGIFARRLKVDVAYHSPQMHACSAKYYSSMADLWQTGSEHSQDKPSVIMVSSVTGSEIDREQVVPYYMVQNLISPVLFADAVREMVAPAEANGSKTLDLLIEIGPHSALAGPVEQILAAHAIKNVEYRSTLTRGQNALDTSLTLAADLFRLGVSLDVSAANGDAGCRLLTNLPSYPWNHSEQFRADSRMQRQNAAQAFPTRSLLGAMMPTMNENERVWRNFIHLNNEPWLRSHTVGTTVLFPAAGMISIVLEAAQQLVDQRKRTSSFKLRDVNFSAAMSLSEDTPTEVTVHMRPHLLATSGSTTSPWMEFTVSSCADPKGQMRNNCRGLLSTIYEKYDSPRMVQEDAEIEARRISDYHRVRKELPEICTDEFFYSRLAKSALPYGEVFQGVRNCHPGFGKTCFDVELLDIGETFTKGKLQRPFLLHAAALDAILQGWAGSTRDNTSLYGDFGFDKPMLPAAMAELEISTDISGDVGYLMSGVCHSQKRSFNEFSADITMFNQEISKVMLSITDFRVSQLEMEVGDDQDTTVEVDPAEISSEVHWNHALDVLEPQEIRQVISDACVKTNGNGLEEVSLLSPTGDINRKVVLTTRGLTQLLQLAIHQRPALTFIELVQSPDQINDTVLSTLPAHLLLPHQVHYAVINSDDGNGSTVVNIEDIFGQVFTLGTLDVPLPADAASADLFLVPARVSNDTSGSLESLLERLALMAKPGALFIIAATTSKIENITTPTLETKGFGLVSSFAAGEEHLALYRNNSSHAKQDSQALTNGALSNGLVNGASTNDALSNGIHMEEVYVLQPDTLSSKGQSVSDTLHDALQFHGYSVVVKTGMADIDVLDNKTCISLLELERSMLEDLSEPEFQSIRRLTVSCKRMLWITCGDSPSFGIVDGFARCANNEVAGSEFQTLHLSSKGMQRCPSLAVRILGTSSSTTDREFRERDGLLQVQRLYRSPEEDSHIHNHLDDSVRDVSLNDETARFELTIGKPGLLDTLHFVHDELAMEAPLADHELELQVHATGINFRDVMASMGLVNVTQLGYEASGIVLKVGSTAAKSFKPGDRVSTVSTGGMHATTARCDSRVTAKMPNSMSFEEGAAAPTVHATAYYALVRLAKLRQGQSVLIHAAAGGVGQAAIQLATHLKLVIYVTVGTEDKRQFLVKHFKIPEEHIFNSRDSSFAKAIQRVTNGRGVDCVLNSLSGELLRMSWTCLANFGTFVEIGVRDITDNMRLDMRPFGKCATFTFFDLTMFISQDPTTLGSVLEEVFKLFHSGVLHVPYPLTVYPVGEVEDAFRIMQQGRHRGKLVLSFSEKDKEKAPVLCKAKQSLKLSLDATYLFIGGLGGLGRSLAKEFVASGARYLAFISRSGDTKAEARATVDELIAQGAKVEVFRADVADEDSFLAAMKQCAQQLPPVKGVVQMAMVLRDAIIENMSYEDWITPLRPKVHGSWNVHQYFSQDRPLDFLIFASSISGICGNPGQAQYDAGNTYQDALASYRREQGLNAVSVNLGIMLDVGVIAESVEHNFKVWEETLGIREPAFHALMKSLINGQQNRGGKERPAQVCVGLGTADILATHGLPSPPWFNDPRFAGLTATSASSTGGGAGSGASASLASRLKEVGENKDQAAAASIITDALVGKTAEILRMPKSEVDPRRPLYTYGVDSLVALEVRNWVTREVKASVAVFDVMAAVPMETFAAQIAQKSSLVMGAAQV